MVQNAGIFASKQAIIHVKSHTLQNNCVCVCVYIIKYTLVIWVTFPGSCWQDKGMSLMLHFPHPYILNIADPLEPSDQSMKQKH